MRVEAEVTHEAPWYVAHWVGHDVAAQGATVDEAVDNLKDAVTSMLPDDEPVVVTATVERPVPVKRDELVRLLEEHGWRGQRASGHHELFRKPGEDRVLTVPVAREVAAGVYRMIARAAGIAPPRPTTADLLRRIDAVFARHPDHGDATAAIRAERDAR